MAEQNNVQVQEPDLNQLRKVRREKLAELQANGQDPFQITKYDADAHSQSIKDNFERWKVKKYQSQDVLCPNVLWVKLHSVMFRI